jgi:non-lysosomal glucosylceramidase
MERRDFLRVTAGTTAGLLSLPVLASGPPEPIVTGLIPEDKGLTPETLAALRVRGQRRVYRGPQRYAIGMPVGGVCAGQAYVLGDGTLGGWHVDGRINSSGWGATNYQTRRVERNLQQGFVISAVDGAGRESSAVLADGLDGGDYDTELVGEYPLAEVRYHPIQRARDVDTTRLSAADSSAPPPLDVTLRAYSSFAPLNAKESAHPCTVLRFALRNSTAGRLKGRLAGWLQNGVEPTPLGEPEIAHRNRDASEPGLTCLLMDAPPPTEPRPRLEPEMATDRVLFDFEGPTYIGWKVRGTAFGSGPAQGTLPNQNPVTGFEGKGLVDSYVGGDDATGEMLSDPFAIGSTPFLTFLIGGGRHPHRTCMNLLVDGKVVRTATGVNNEKLELHAWSVREFENQKAQIQIIDAQTGPWGHINVDQIKLVPRLPAELLRPKPDSPANGTMALSHLGVGATVRHIADPREPLGRLRDLHATVQSSSEEYVSSDSESPVGAVAADFDLGPGESTELVFVISWHFPNLHTNHGQMYSNWFKDALEVARYVAKNDKRLYDQTELFRKTYYEDTTLPWWLALRLMMPTSTLATGTSQWWKDGRFWAYEGVGCCDGTCTHVWNYSHAEARLFPELARSTRTMQDLGSAFEEETGRVAFRGEVKGGSEYATDGQAGTVLKCYREHLCSVDGSFLKSNWPRIKKTLEYLIAKDAEAGKGAASEADGIIEGAQPNTYDIDFVGPNTFAGSLYLAALLAGAAMAERVNDRASADRYRALAQRGRVWTEKNLFNGRYFTQIIPKGQSDRFQYGSGCLSDQLFGQTWSRLLDLGTVYDEDKVRTALKSIYRYNWSPAVGQYNAQFPPERYFAKDREGGLFVCTWPEGGRQGEPVRYRDEVWTGGEYQVATGLLWEGLVDEALVIIKAIDERYDGAIHNPWNEVECGDHYARAMAAWGAYQALCGFTYDGPAGTLGMAPRLTPENFAAFFSGAEGWGLLKQTREGRTQTNTVEVRWGRLRLKSFAAALPAEAAAPTLVSVTAAGRTIQGRHLAGPASATVAVSEPMTLEAGQSLDVRWSW